MQVLHDWAAPGSVMAVSALVLSLVLYKMPLRWHMLLFWPKKTAHVAASFVVGFLISKGI